MVSDGNSWSQIGVVSWGIGMLLQSAHFNFPHSLVFLAYVFLQSYKLIECNSDHYRVWTGSLSRRLCTRYILFAMDREKQADRIKRLARVNTPNRTI